MRTITIGRSRSCDIVVVDPTSTVSSIHAEISIENGKYIYRDVSRNGTNVSGRIVVNGVITLEPGQNVILANKVPLPWAQVYTLLPLSYVGNNSMSNSSSYTYNNNNDDELGFVLGLISFLWPLVGWILWAVWKSDKPVKAKQAAKWAWIGFAVGFIGYFFFFLIAAMA